MTKDDIMKLARKAGFNWPEIHTTTIEERLERFADLVAAHKAEVALAEAYRCGYKDGMGAAAVVCENLPMQRGIDVYEQCAAAIRAMGTT